MSFKYKMVNTRLSMIYDRASTAKSNMFYAMQSAELGQEQACANYLASFKADMDSIKEQWQDMQRAMSDLAEMETKS